MRLDDSLRRRDPVQRRVVRQHLDAVVVHQLNLMHSGDDLCVGGHLAKLAEDAQLQVGKAATLAGASALRSDRHTADDDHVHRLHFFKMDGLAHLYRAL